MKYRGFIAKIDYDENDNIFVGVVTNSKHALGFAGQSVEELEQKFKELIDFHIETNKTNDRPYSGNLMLRISPQTHAKIAGAAQTRGISLNQWAEEALIDGANN